MITGIDHPTSGEILVNGVAIHKMNENQLALWRGRSTVSRGLLASSWKNKKPKGRWKPLWPA
jgi:predicted ABC-type transport system involved in lysophospholipase L1 biosynthesis ATPase subunit